MTAITKIKATIHTANISTAGADGVVFLGICGREFRLASAISSENDFAEGTHIDFILGDGATVKNAGDNDPRKPQLDTADAERYPAYIRLEALTKDWNLDGADVTISPGGARFNRLGDGGEENLWLGQTSGKICYLRKM